MHKSIIKQLELLNHTKQVLVVDDSVYNEKQIAELTAWEKLDGKWQRQMEPQKVTVGKNGIISAAQKFEGDLCTPDGVHKLLFVFGEEASVKTDLPYYQVGENDFWVDDKDSVHYNKWVKGVVEAKSWEKMKREDSLYRYTVVMDYNMEPVIPGKGSAIFIHTWKEENVGTEGCVAMPQERLKLLLSWLRYESRPCIMILPVQKII